jgi:hypothetical protein
MFRRILYVLFAILFFLTGCSLEEKLARTYIESEKKEQFFIMKPSFIFKNNLKTYDIPGIDSLDNYTRDSLLMAKSLFLKDISDSVLIGEFTDVFVKSLRGYGSDVLLESAVDTLMENGGTPYVINIAQFSLEEYIHPYSSEEMVYDEVFTIEGFDVNAINYNAWFEIGRLNTENSNKVLFATDYITDSVDGTMKQNIITGKLRFDYTIDTITMSGIYNFAGRFAELTAGYIFDYLMNNYITEHLPRDYPYGGYYHYDPERKLIYPVGDNERIHDLNGD